MRRCAKTRCDRVPAATASLHYGAREVRLVELLHTPDPRSVDLCEEHIERLIPPIGWAVRDERSDRAADGSAGARGTVSIHR